MTQKAKKTQQFSNYPRKKQIFSTSTSLDSRSHSQVSLVSGLKRSTDWKPGGMLGSTSVIPPTHCAAPLPRTLPVTLRVFSVCLQSEQQENAGQPRGAAWPNPIDSTKQTELGRLLDPELQSFVGTWAEQPVCCVGLR